MPQLGTQQAITNGRVSAYGSVDAPLAQRYVHVSWSNAGLTTIVGEALTVINIGNHNTLGANTRKYQRQDGDFIWGSQAIHTDNTEDYPPNEQRTVTSSWENGGNNTIVGELLTVLQVQSTGARQYLRADGSKIWSSLTQYTNQTTAY